MIRISDETFSTNTASGVRITSSIKSTILSTASVHTPATLTSLRSAGARIPIRTKDRGASASRERITHHSFKTDTGRTVRADNTLSIVSTDHALALADTFSSLLVFSESTLASTPSRMPFGNADGVCTARQRTARVDTDIVFASQLSRTIIVFIALGST